MIRLAELEDIYRIMEVFEAAKAFMRKSGNLNQWSDGYPSICDITADVIDKVFYVMEVEGKIEAVFAMINSPEPNYLKIDGAWLTDNDYIVLHRVASTGVIKGVFKKVVYFALLKTNTIRVDTHRDNIPMQNAILNCGFKYCGIIYLKDGSDRLAYELAN